MMHDENLVSWSTMITQCTKWVFGKPHGHIKHIEEYIRPTISLKKYIMQI